MNLSYRRMRPGDVAECHTLPLLDRFAYDDATWARLPDFWRRTLDEGSAIAYVVEDADRPPGERLASMDLGVFLSDEFAEEAKTRLPPGLSRQVVDRWLAGRSPLLGREAVRAANAGDGLTLLCLHSAMRLPLFDACARPVHDKSLEAFVAMCSGYHLREFLVHAYGREQMGWNVNSGMSLRTDYAGFSGAARFSGPAEGREPYLLGINRAEASSSFGCLLGFLFAWQPPVFGFTAREQELLETALGGQSDEEAAETLALSVPAVRKRWQAIYAQAERVRPELLGAEASQKKRPLLSYLRAHPEELRPLPPRR